MTAYRRFRIQRHLSRGISKGAPDSEEKLSESETPGNFVLEGYTELRLYMATRWNSERGALSTVSRTNHRGACIGSRVVDTFDSQSRTSSNERPRGPLEQKRRPVTVVTEENVRKIEKLVLADRRIKLWQIAEELQISKERVGEIIHEHMNMRKSVRVEYQNANAV
ncbi:Putative uncharacterized protein FLJ37770 [Eumeta japonica]|uniref:Uncharacterized protein n=1 Tax=Eumeta variegata TaxID=151549 RepID=A0A4C1VTR5_EUMVA|nr:Putative uncharacterized protein FLJ37770 [Eumeta japonica]